MKRKVTLSKLSLKDVPKMVNWGKHLDPRFYHYNFDITTEQGFLLWFKSKKKIFYKKIYKVENDNNEMVGFITIKNINWVSRTAEMGIVFDPNNLGSGYGSSGIALVLEEFFNKLNMNRLYLRVAIFNERAYKSYINSGFVEYKRVNEAFEYQKLNKLLNQRYDDFDLVDGILYADYIYMHVTRDRYDEISKK